MDSLDDIFLNAREVKDPARRAAYLDQACGGDTVLRARVEAMLRDAEGAEEFFGKAGTVVVAPIRLTEQAGTIIGRYKLLQKIGEGGMGVVYMAEQREPVVRKVALKIIKLGMDTRQVVARFEAERQALALMDHPNIAKVLDGGATETGRPYFVMELVQGLPITQFCDDGNLPTSERITLFLDVCSAVQHAHQKGIIHRDLKPSNILVTLHGDKPVPKVIDFGVAKATQGRLTDKTVFTQFQQFIGTPAYMSPEQASLSGLDVDTRSDIYALGVLLYELLTGKTPFDAKELLKAGLDQMRQIIREQEPPKPSTRLSTMAGQDLTTAAKHRHTEPPKLVHLVRGDLDWIVMKCLEKDRARRYETANGLAMDLQRHLNDEPVVACPPSTLYRVGKAIRRNKIVFTASTAVGVALLIGLVVSVCLWRREIAAYERAVAAERAQARLREEAEMNRRRAEFNLSLERGMQARREGNLTNAESLFRSAMAEGRAGWTDEPAKWSRSIGGLVDVLLRQKKFTVVEELAGGDLAALITQFPQDTSLREIRAEFFARRARWVDAIADTTVLMELEPANWQHFHRMAPLLVAVGEESRYQKLCRQIVANFSSTTNPIAAGNMAKACVILPGSGADLGVVSNLARIAVTARAANPGDLAIMRFTMGLVEYRLGKPGAAVEWILPSINTTSNVYAYVEAYAVLAMARQQLGQSAEAAAILAQASQLQQDESPQLESGDLTFDWRAWVRQQALLRETRTLIESPK